MLCGLWKNFQVNDLEMVGNGTFCRGMRGDLNSRSMSGNDDWFGFPESELRSRVVSVFVRRPLSVLSSENESSFGCGGWVPFLRQSLSFFSRQ